MSYTINLRTRNQSTGALGTSDITLNVTQGFSFVEKLDDSLDIGTMTIRNSETSTPYSMFDTIEVKDGSTVIYSQRVAGDSVKLISKNPLRYEHTLTLVEHTKILERFQISGKTFTQPTDGTVRYYLYDVFEDLINTTPLETSTNLSTTRVCKLPTSGTLYTFLTTEESPEFTFKDVTLREAFTQVAGYFDAIPRLYLNSSDEIELTFDYVNELKTLISSENDFIEKELTQDISLYGTQLESETLNLVNDALIGESVEIYPPYGAYISGRSDKYIYNFLDSFAQTPKPIYKVEKLVARIPYAVQDNLGNYLYGTSAGSPYAIFDIRIKDLIVEIGDYNKLPALRSTAEWRTIPRTGNTLPFSKESTLPYTFKQKNIQIGTTSGLFGTRVNLVDVLDYSIYQMMIDDGHIAYTVPPTSVTILKDPTESIQDTVFQTHYVPVPTSQRLNIDRDDLSDIDTYSTLLANQQGRIINLEHFTNNMLGRINRIGNSELQLDNRAESYSDLYEIGDYTDDMYIITDKEVVFFNDYVYAKYGLSKNYNMISKFIGVNSEVRQYEIGEKNTQDRNLMYKEYIMIDVVDSGSGRDTSQLIQTDGKKSYMDTLLKTSTLEPVRGGMIVGDDFSDTIYVPISSNGGGNSLIFSWKFDDNVNVSNQIESVSGQDAWNFVPYADDSGISENFTMYMYNKVNTGITTMAQHVTFGDNYPVSNLTYIDKSLLKNDTRLQMYKDSREVIGGTIQLQQKSKSSHVGLGRWLSLRNRLVSENPPSTILLYHSDTLQFGRTDTLNIPSGYSGTSSVTITQDYLDYTSTVSGIQSSWASWALTDEDGKILIWCNQDGTKLDTITFDFVNKDPNVKYKY